jgi:hypothetical protein
MRALCIVLLQWLLFCDSKFETLISESFQRGPFLTFASAPYEVWFVRLALTDGGGAWWIRYLLMNPGRCGCADGPQGMPVQVWATWFPRFIQGFPLEGLDLSARRQNPFHFRIGKNEPVPEPCWRWSAAKASLRLLGLPQLPSLARLDRLGSARGRLPTASVLTPAKFIRQIAPSPGARRRSSTLKD